MLWVSIAWFLLARSPGGERGRGSRRPLLLRWLFGPRTPITNFEVATGQVLVPSVGPTRPEEAFVRHIEHTIALDPTAAWVFIVDRFNTYEEDR
jgi:hypothetical protein